MTDNQLRHVSLHLVILILLFLGMGFSGTAAAEPIEISDADDLQKIEEDLDADYVLVDDIALDDVESFSTIGKCNLGDLESSEGCRGRTFDGSLDGGGHVISNLTLESVEKEVAFFGGIGAEGEVRNLELMSVDIIGGPKTAGLAAVNLGYVENVEVRGKLEGGYHSGLVAGLNLGRISGSGSMGTVESDRTSYGGLVGQNGADWWEEDEAVIEVSTADVMIESAGETSSMVGGLTGSNYGLITNSVSKGDVGVDADVVGGLTGSNLGKVKSSHAEGDVKAQRAVGGLIGQQGRGTNDAQTVSSYSTGNVEGENNVGGLVGRLDTGEVSKSWSGSSVSGGDPTGGLIGQIGFREMKENGAAIFKDSYWTVENPDYPTVGTIERGEGDVVVNNVTPPVEFEENEGGEPDGNQDERLPGFTVSVVLTTFLFVLISRVQTKHR